MHVYGSQKRESVKKCKSGFHAKTRRMQMSESEFTEWENFQNKVWAKCIVAYLLAGLETRRNI
jgi:hypothetical protein